MGTAKELLLIDEGRRAIAIEIALEVGLLKKCEVCEEIYNPIDEDKLISAYKLANHRMTKDPLMLEYFGNRTTLTDIIKEIPTEFSDCRCVINRDD